jgi:hypothetical protein
MVPICSCVLACVQATGPAEPQLLAGLLQDMELGAATGMALSGQGPADAAAAGAEDPIEDG